MFPFAEIFGAFPGHSHQFRREYKCYSAVMFPNSNRTDVDQGGKIIMPPSALEVLSRMNIQFPMLFKLQNNQKNRSTHCGVLEFIADEGKIYVPSWMMRNLLLQEGDLVSLQSISLPVATYSKFQPQSIDFLDITDPRAVLESALRFFACITVGDVIAIEYNKKVFELLVMECRPANAVTIIECDMQVEFAAPVGYKEPEPQFRNVKPAVQEDEPMMVDRDVLPSMPKFEPFEGSGMRLGGHKKKSSVTSVDVPPTESGSKKKIDVATLAQKGIPNYDWKPGKITFRRNVRKQTISESEKTPSFSAFTGVGMSLKRGPK